MRRIQRSCRLFALPSNKQLERTVIRRHVRAAPPLSCGVMRQFSAVAVVLMTCGCATSPLNAQQDDLVACQSYFSPKGNWVLVKSVPTALLRTQRRFNDPVAHDIGGHRNNSPSLWYTHKVDGKFGVCMPATCGVDDCTWPTRTFSNVDGKWQQISEQDIAAFYSGG
jgi:hypothetical protein